MEMRGAAYGIELVEVVRYHAQLDQALGEPYLRLHIVIHSSEEHRLVEDRDPFIHEPRESRCRTAHELGRMVRVDDEDRCEPRPSEPAEEVIVHALGKDDGQA